MQEWSLNLEPWKIETIQKVDKFLKRKLSNPSHSGEPLTKNSDRSYPLFAAAYLDNSLSDLLYLSLVTEKRIESEVFKENVPLFRSPLGLN